MKRLILLAFALITFSIHSEPRLYDHRPVGDSLKTYRKALPRDAHIRKGSMTLHDKAAAKDLTVMMGINVCMS